MRLWAGGRFARTGAALLTVMLLVVACGPAADLAGRVEDEQQATSSPVEKAGEDATVLRIIDGDTFDARLADGRTERVRPAQFDAPERGECWYDEATDLLERLVGGRTVRLVPLAAGPDRDRGGRLLRAVEVSGQDVGERMLTDGAARWLDRHADEDARLAEMYEVAQDHAREERTGAWATCPNWR